MLPPGKEVKIAAAWKKNGNHLPCLSCMFLISLVFRKEQLPLNLTLPVTQTPASRHLQW